MQFVSNIISDGFLFNNIIKDPLSWHRLLTSSTMFKNSHILTIAKQGHMSMQLLCFSTLALLSSFLIKPQVTILGLIVYGLFCPSVLQFISSIIKFIVIMSLCLLGNISCLDLCVFGDWDWLIISVGKAGILQQVRITDGHISEKIILKYWCNC